MDLQRERELARNIKWVALPVKLLSLPVIWVLLMMGGFAALAIAAFIASKLHALLAGWF